MFRRFIFASSLLTSICVPSLVSATTLSDSVSQALSSHPQIKASEASREQAGKNIWEQRSAFFPVIGLDAQAGRLRNDDKTTRANTANNGGASSWMGEGTVSLIQPVFSGFSSVNMLNGAEERYSAETYDLNVTEEDVALRAAHAHLNLMRTRDLLALASQFLSDIESRRENIALMVKEGAADEAELLQADEIRVAAKNTRLGYEESFHQAEADYMEVYGALPDSKLEIGEEKWNALIPATVEDAVAAAASSHPRILSADKIYSALDSETKAERSSLMPHVDAEMSYMKQDELDVVGGETTSAQAMLKLGWNFSTGGGQLARIEKGRQQQAEAAAKRRGLARTVERDVRQKYSSMLIVDQQFTLLSDRENASKKILANFTAQFDGGKQTNLQLIAANSRVFEAQASARDAFYRRILSRLELLNAMGRLHNTFITAKTGISRKG